VSPPLTGRWRYAAKRAQPGAIVRETRVQLRVTGSQRASWRRAARAHGVTLSAWVSALCDAAVPLPVPDEASEMRRDAEAADRLRVAREARRAKETP
jgi:uncharacterized protein (DUF1778 family)